MIQILIINCKLKVLTCLLTFLTLANFFCAVLFRRVINERFLKSHYCPSVVYTRTKVLQTVVLRLASNLQINWLLISAVTRLAQFQPSALSKPKDNKPNTTTSIKYNHRSSLNIIKYHINWFFSFCAPPNYHTHIGWVLKLCRHACAEGCIHLITFDIPERQVCSN